VPGFVDITPSTDRQGVGFQNDLYLKHRFMCPNKDS
jgi:hypothetical protein